MMELNQAMADDESFFTVAKHNAVGIRAIEGAVNDDKELILGGDGAEYEGCPETLILNHLFDGVIHPALADGIAEAPQQQRALGSSLARAKES